MSSTNEREVDGVDPVPAIYLKLAGEEYDPPRRSVLHRLGAVGLAAMVLAVGGVLMPADDALADGGDEDDDVTATEPSLGSDTGGATVTEPSSPSAPSEPSTVTTPSDPSAPSEPSVSQPSATSASVPSPRER